MILRAFTLCTAILAFSGTAFAVTATEQEANVTQEQVEAAHAAGGIEMARQEAEAALDTLYGFEMGPVRADCAIDHLTGAFAIESAQADAHKEMADRQGRLSLFLDELCRRGLSELRA